MREILFRGKGDKKYNDGMWYFGVPIRCYDGDWQICTNNSKRVVIPETIGQYTGVTDKNGERIFEGDIVKYKEACKFGDNDEMEEAEEQYLCTNIVEFKNGRFFPLPQRCDCEDYFFSYGSYDFEVVGNVHDNPELLRGNNNG